MFMIPFSLSIVLIMLSIAPFWSKLLFGDYQETTIIRLALGLAFAEICFILAAAYITARVKSLLFITVSIGKFIVGITLNLYLVYYLRRGVEGIILANLINSSIFSMILVFATLREVGFKFDVRKLKEMLRFGLPFVPGGVFLFILNSGDRFFLLHYGGEAAVGLYALGYKFALLIMVFVMAPFLQVWSALMVPVSRKENGPEMISRVFTYVMFLYVWVGLGMSVLASEVVTMVADPKFYHAYHIIPIVVLAYLFWATANIGDTPFYVTKRTGVKPFILGAAALVNLVLYRLFIPAYGGWGAAWATLISFIFFAILTRIVAQRTLRIPYDNFRFGKLLFVALAAYAASRFIPWPTPDYIWKALYCLLFPAVLYAMGFFDDRERAKIKELWTRHVLRRPEPAAATHDEGAGRISSRR